MSVRRAPARCIAAAVAVLTGASALSVSAAQGEPIDNPCAQLAVPFCGLIPMMPDQEGDIDLSLQQPPAREGPTQAEAQVPIQLCAVGCL